MERTSKPTESAHPLTLQRPICSMRMECSGPEYDIRQDKNDMLQMQTQLCTQKVEDRTDERHQKTTEGRGKEEGGSDEGKGAEGGCTEKG